MNINKSRAANRYRNRIDPNMEALVSESAFADMICFERRRSDRFGCEFAVVDFHMSEDTERITGILTDAIVGGKRSIDCVGWSIHGTISVLLPDTSQVGAEFFAKKIKAHLGMDSAGVSCEVYAYPQNWLENPRQGIHQDIQSNGHPSRTKTEVELKFTFKLPLWKRVLDIIGAALLLLVTFPLLFAVAILIKVVSPGPIFFRQPRIGYRGIPFSFFKFRTMKPENNQGFHGKHSQDFIRKGDIPMQKLDTHDPRIIPGGRLLRASCIDEMPQLWNVLKGEMSLVGPRPCIPYEAEQYLRWNTHRFDTVPGMTGLWQVSGKNKLTFKQMIRLDIQYSNQISFWGDILILLKTPVTVVSLLLDALRQKNQSSAEDMTEDIESVLQS